MRRRLLICLLAAGLAFTGTGRVARAQSPAPAATDTAQSLYERARGLYKLQKYRDAIDLLNRAIQLDNTIPKAYVLRGDALASDGDDRAALKDYDRAIVLDSDYEYAYSTRCDTRR